MPETTYRVRGDRRDDPDDAVPVDDADDAEFLSRLGYYVTAATEAEQ